jgi:hypothetical protein
VVPTPPGEQVGALEVETWRVVTLFVAILATDTLWGLLDKLTTDRLRNSRTGLLHAWEHLKFEVCALGVVSLLLAVFEVPLSLR